MLEDLSQKISEAFKNRATRYYWASMLIKVVLIAIGSGLATIAQFAEFSKDGPTTWQVIGIGASVAVIIGAIYVVFIDSDASKELEIARTATEHARALERDFSEIIEEFDNIETDTKRSVELYFAMSQMRGIIEQSLASGAPGEISVISNLLNSVRRSATISLGFSMTEEWTICLYKANFNEMSKRTELVCVWHHRAIECAYGDARIWFEGVGVGGVAYAKRSEVIVPDLNDSGLGSTFNLGDLRRDYDSDRYRSLAAVPVSVGSDVVPWGVVIATTDKPHHFGPSERAGVQTAEAVRALAGMVALAISTSRSNSRSSESPPVHPAEAAAEPPSGLDVNTRFTEGVHPLGHDA